jgi:hypothetical protein
MQFVWGVPAKMVGSVPAIGSLPTRLFSLPARSPSHTRTPTNQQSRHPYTACCSKYDRDEQRLFQGGPGAKGWAHRGGRNSDLTIYPHSGETNNIFRTTKMHVIFHKPDPLQWCSGLVFITAGPSTKLFAWGGDLLGSVPGGGPTKSRSWGSAPGDRDPGSKRAPMLTGALNKVRGRSA